LYDFTKEIGGNKLEVTMLLVPGKEAHSYEPTPKDIIRINESSLFIYIGQAMEPWVKDILASISNNKTNILEIGNTIPMIDTREINTSQHEENEQDHHHAKDHHHKKEDHKDHEANQKVKHAGEPHEHHAQDPHIWLDFELAQKTVALIAIELGKIDGANKEFYLENAKRYQEKLGLLDQKYRETILRCQLRTIMYGGHFAFGYLAKRYGLKYISPYAGFSSNAEPTPHKIAFLIEQIKKYQIDTLFIEELLEPKVAQTISSETGVKLEILHGAHNLSQEEFTKNLRFLEIMEVNLEKLKQGLKYK
jgi:zinc transport system substrate-binding protein